MFKFWKNLKEKISHSESKRSEEKDEKLANGENTERIASGDFTLNDFATQLKAMEKLGSLKKLMRFVPGAGNVSPEAIKKGQEEAKLFIRIIESLPPEDKNKSEVHFSSMKIIKLAEQLGVKEQDIRRLLERFEQSKHFVKMYGKKR